MSALPVIRIAPNNQVFDLPVIVGIEEGLFRDAGLSVVWPDLLALTAIGLLFFVIALARFRKSLAS